MENKVHYKLHKVKKQWVTIAVASAALATVVGGLSATTSSVSADETQDKIVTQPNLDTTADLVTSTEATKEVDKRTNTKEADVLTPAKETNAVETATTTNTQATAEAAKIDVYKAATIEKLNTVIEEATKVLNDTSANKEAVEEAIRALNTAIANLEKYVTEAELDQVIAKGEEFLGKTDIYTKESLDILSTALAKVRSAITSGDKEAIESAYAQLTEAIDKLVKIDAPTPEVKPEVKPENKPNTSVKTGDNTYLGAIMTSLLLSAGGLVLFKKRKYN